MYKRANQRKLDELRSFKIEKNIAPAATGSVLIQLGNTQVICAANVEEKVPPWMRMQKVEGGWISAEYSLLPYSTSERKKRETNKLSGRTQEIQRFIGRSLRAAINLKKLGERTLWIDCDVLQADAGTRTASITGGFLAMEMALNHLREEGKLEENPIYEPVAAISVGIVEDTPLLDLCYEEDLLASVDMNIVMTASGKYIEIQGTAEKNPYTNKELQNMCSLAEKGIQELFAECFRHAQPEHAQ